MTAASALVVGDVAKDLRSAASMAGQSIDSGAAATKLEQLVRATNVQE
jgi:anthranilate phosphoribosyltransferase